MAVSVSPELFGLRQTCDSMNIKWHWKHKESSLETLIKEKTVPGTIENFAVDVIKPATEVAEPEREKRHIPQDVLSALEYCDGYHRGNTRRIREYIESLL